MYAQQAAAMLFIPKVIVPLSAASQKHCMIPRGVIIRPSRLAQQSAVEMEQPSQVLECKATMHKHLWSRLVVTSAI